VIVAGTLARLIDEARLRRPEFASQVMHRKVSSRHPPEAVRGAVQKMESRTENYSPALCRSRLIFQININIQSGRCRDVKRPKILNHSLSARLQIVQAPRLFWLIYID
jgi:hypothetical protein